MVSCTFRNTPVDKTPIISPYWPAQPFPLIRYQLKRHATDEEWWGNVAKTRVILTDNKISPPPLHLHLCRICISCLPARPRCLLWPSLQGKTIICIYATRWLSFLHNALETRSIVPHSFESSSTLIHLQSCVGLSLTYHYPLGLFSWDCSFFF